MSHISKGLLQRSYYYFPKGTFINFFMKKFEPDHIKEDKYVMERYPPIIVDKVYLFKNNINFRETIGSYQIDEDFSKDKAFKNSGSSPTFVILMAFNLRFGTYFSIAS